MTSLLSLSLSASIRATPCRTGLCAARDQTLDVLVRVQTPAAAVDASASPPMALALVLDRSGSMAGRPLDETRRCALHVLSRLRPDDSVAIVAFDHRAQRLWPAAPRGDGAAQRAVLESIQPGGNTDLHGGWHEGADTLADVAGNGLKRVLLLSDGQANEGETRPGEIASRCAAAAARGISTSTFGLGGHFNEELMVAMARAGGGGHHYGDTAEDLMAPFEQEMALLDQLCLRDLSLAVELPAGGRAEMLNRLPAAGAGWRLPDLAWDAEAWAVLRLTIPASALPPVGGRCTVLRVAVTGHDLHGRAVRLERTALSLPVLAPAAHEALAEDPLVLRRTTELAAADLLEQMRGMAAAGDWPQVGSMLDAARQRFGPHEWLAAVLEQMQTIAREQQRERALKELLYSAGTLRTRLAARDEQRWSATAEAIDVPAYLQRRSSQGKADR